MLKLDPQFISDLLRLLGPLMGSERERQAILIKSFGPNSALYDQIDCSGSTGSFLPRLLQKLVEFGEVPEGEQALVLLLKTAQKMVGREQQGKITEHIYQLEYHAVKHKRHEEMARLVYQTKEQTKLLQGDLTNKKRLDLGSMALPLSAQSSNERFDVFLCHNSQDKPAIRQISKELKMRGLLPWLDEEQLIPGRSWQEALEQEVTHIKTAAVFVGQDGIGPWQNLELRAFLGEFVSRNCPVIPVILPTAPQKPELPIFLRDITWVDFRSIETEPMNRLIWGITGTRS